MKKETLSNVIAACVNDVVFVYNGKKSGVTSEVKNSVPTFQTWHGSETKEYNNIADVMNDAFYGGKSLNDLANEIDIRII